MDTKLFGAQALIFPKLSRAQLTIHQVQPRTISAAHYGSVDF